MTLSSWPANFPVTTGCGTPHKVILIEGELLSPKVKLLGKTPWQNSGPPKWKTLTSTKNKHRFHDKSHKSPSSIQKRYNWKFWRPPSKHLPVLFSHTTLRYYVSADEVSY